MSQIKDKEHQQDDVIAKRIIEEYMKALQERGDIVFLALSREEYVRSKTKAPKDAPLYFRGAVYIIIYKIGCVS